MFSLPLEKYPIETNRIGNISSHCHAAYFGPDSSSELQN